MDPKQHNNIKAELNILAKQQCTHTQDIQISPNQMMTTPSNQNSAGLYLIKFPQE